MTETVSNQGLPEFLRSFEELTAHFDEHFDNLGSNDRGETFLELARKIIPLTEEGSTFPAPEPSPKKSHDGGIDLLSTENAEGVPLCAQSKYKIRSKDEIDSIISKFQDYESRLIPIKQQDLFPNESEPEVTEPAFFIVTSSKTAGILKKYEQSTLASLQFYNKLKNAGRLVVIDGVRILQILQQLYRKTHLLPAYIELSSTTQWSRSGDVLFGIMRGADLVSLHQIHGDALFFENIREFLGASSGKVATDRSTVNQEIIHTIRREPTKMLARNNGITFRTAGAETIDERTIKLSMAAIVNGCQTTMCLVNSSPVASECLISVKVVKSDDAWDIAKAANHQNPVARVDLDLARYLRPQLARRVAASLGYAVETDNFASASAALNSIYRNRIQFEELRLLCLGFFSRKPNNLFEGNYAEIREDVLSTLYDIDGCEEALFSVLLILLKESQVALSECKEVFNEPEYAPLFKRFYDEERPRYRVYLAVLSICALVRDNLSDRNADTNTEVARVRSFLGNAKRRLENDSAAYREAYLLTFQALADLLLEDPASQTENEIAQVMYRKVSSTPFSSLYKRVLMRLDGERKRRSHRKSENTSISFQ
jgi:hypothetical protein